MKATIVREHGGLDALLQEEVPTPEPGPGEVQVAVEAAALNHLDLWVRRGVPGHRFPLPMIPGCDGAGTISAVGAGVSADRVGEKVVLAPGLSCGECFYCSTGQDHLCATYGILGETRDGTNAEFLTLPAENALPRPAGLTAAESAALPLVFLTAWGMLFDRAQLKSGETVLVHAAGSGVGSATIQLAKLVGARVIATASTPEKRAAAEELGAEATFDYTQEGWSKEIYRWSGKQGLDVVVEHAGAETFPQSLRCLKKGGRLTFCGATSGAEVTLNLRAIFFKSWSILGSTMGSRGTLHRIFDLAGQGLVRPVIDRVLTFEEVAQAHGALEDRAQFGKVVLSRES
ncbi:MAG: zinc-binding dehydrogenase [Acidobacteriota bacterium]